MHQYYSSHIKNYRKDIYILCNYVRTEMADLFSEEPDLVINGIQDSFVEEILPDMPYVGGSSNSNDTSNLISCCEFAAFFVVGRRHGVSDEGIGELLHTAWKRKHKRVSPGTSRILRDLLSRKIVQRTILPSFASKSERMSGKYEYAWLFEYAEPDDEYSVKIYCTRCGACRYLMEKGLGDIMPYICNIDFETASAYGIPYYRNEVIAYGDKRCANLVKRNAPVITDNYPPHGLRCDGLK